MGKKIFYLNLFTMIFIALNLRAPITSIAPLVEPIQSYFKLSSALVGFLTTLPLLSFGVFSFVVSKLHHIKAMILGLCFIIIGEIMRAYGEYFMQILSITNEQILQMTRFYALFCGTLIMGAGIAIANVLLPSFIKSKFRRNIAQMMGIYSLTLNTSAILGLLLALTLMRYFGLLGAMAFWSIFGFIALLFYLPQAKNNRLNRAKITPQNPNFNIFKLPSAWQIAAFMGTQSFMFYGLIVWLPKIIESKGYSIQAATFITLISQFVAIAAAFLIPAMLGSMRMRTRGIFMSLTCFLYVIGILGLYFVESRFYLYAVAAILGVPMGSVFTIALLFITQKSSSVAVSIRLSAFAQGFGYLIASVAPFVIGVLRDIFGDFKEAIILLCAVALSLCALGYIANKVKAI